MSPSEHHETSDHPTYKILSLILGVLIGLVFVGLAFFNDPKLCEFVHQLLFSIGMGILLSVFGTQISGKYKRFHIAGAGGIVLVLFGILFLYHTPNNCQAQPSASKAAQPPAPESAQPSAPKAAQPSASESAQPSASKAAQPSASESAQPLAPKSDRPPAPVRSMCPSPAKATPEGWVYVGTNLGRHWDKKHFNWDSYNKRLPGSGDVLTATGLVNLRKQFGERAPIVGTICPDEQVQVLETRAEQNSYHWVRIKRTQKEQDSL